MSTERTKDSASNKPAPTKGAGPANPVTLSTTPIPKVAPFFRNIDWLTLGITTLLVFIGYFLTVAPDVTLEDSGELSVGSYYAAVPHPPGYPFWSVFTYIFLNIFRVGNIAYRVAVASAVCGALASGLLAMLVSRGSSMILEGIAEFKELSKSLENAICLVSGVTSGLLLAFNGYMWSQCVIVEVYPISVLSLMVAYCLLLRWMYAPHQRRYIYLTWLVLGLGFTNHQTLLLTTMGLEIAIIAAQPKLGRDLLLGNSVIYIAGLLLITGHMMGAFEMSPMVFVIFNMVGIVSIIGCIWLAVITKGFGNQTLPVLAMFFCWALGAAFFFYMPITSMTNPPMNWGYPRTWDGFIHAFTRGQYEKINPTDFLHDPTRLINQMSMYCTWVQDEFNLVNLVLVIVPIIFFFRMQRRERAWLIGLAGFWFCLALVLLVLLNPSFDRASRDLNKVFFASSYTVIAMFIGYGLTLVAALMATQYQKFRLWALCGGGIAVTLALITLYLTTQIFVPDEMEGPASMMRVIQRAFAPDQYGLPIFGDLLLVGLAVAFLVVSLMGRAKAQMGVVLAIFALLPVRSITAHWSDNEERNHWFGYWFGHDMFTPPFGVYPEMTRDAVLFGGTDPGRFCPTYMIFDESIIPHDKQPKEDQKFDRRDVYIITQNALADPTYLEYIRAHYNRSAQIDPPFFQEMFRSKKEQDQNYTTNILARIAYQVLDRPLTAWGAKVEARRRAEHIYPPEEIHTPNLEEHSRAFQEYMADAQQRLEHDMRFTNEPRQIKPGEDVHPSGNGQVSVSGQVAVMSINGLLTKVIFDANPKHEFFVEESFPLDWMYPYLTPFGVIMKINRQPLDTIPQDAIDKDHKFWKMYSQRLVGDWIDYDTPVKDIAAFVEKVYLERNFSGFKGDRAFIRDDQGQKSFSKLRSSIGGIYDWRFHHAKNAVEQQQMLKEADFAFRQAFAFCPYSPEAVFRYVNLLLFNQKLDDAFIVANTCHRLDPNNLAVEDLLKQLSAYKAQRDAAGNVMPPQSALPQLEKAYADNSNNFQNAFNLAGAYLQFQQKDKALAILDNILSNTNADAGAMIVLAQAYAQMTNYAKLETTLERVTQLQPNSPEAWCDLAGLKSVMGKTAEALVALQHSVNENARRMAQTPGTSNLLDRIRTDQRFIPLHNLPEYQKMVGP